MLAQSLSERALPVRPSGLALASLLFASLASVASAQGQNIGDPTGRSGKFPLLQTPIGNPFTFSATNDYFPAAGSATERHYLLGKALFWDEQVSSDNTVACATCHIPEAAGVDARGSFLATNNGFGSLGVLPQDPLELYIAGTPVSQQQEVTGIIAPTMINAAFAERLFWDVRAGPNFTFESGLPILLGGIDQFANFAALEDQSVDPPASPVEMAHDGVLNWATGQIQAKLGPAAPLHLATPSTIPADLVPFTGPGTSYTRFFNWAFSTDPNFGGLVGVTRERFAVAVATYERTLISNQAPIDTGPLTAAQLAGFNILVGSQCFRCHSDQPVFFGNTVPVLTGTGGFVDAMDAMLTDNRRHAAIGFPSTPGALPGTQAQGSFNSKTPSLRNLKLQPRFAHNGFFTSLALLLDFYDRRIPGAIPTFPFDGNGAAPGIPQLTPAQRLNVEAFLDSLVDPRLIPAAPGAPLAPPFDHPDLYSQRVPFGSNEPATHGGTPAVPGGPIPDIIAHVPQMIGDPNMKLGVREAPANSPVARLHISRHPLPAIPPVGPLKLNPAGMVTLTTTTDVNGFGTRFLTPAPATAATLVVSAQWEVIDPVSGNSAWSNAAQWVMIP